MFNNFYLSLSILCALLVYILDYGLGKPADEKFSTKELLFFWSLFLATRRLKQLNAWFALKKQHEQMIMTATSDAASRVTIDNNFKIIVFQKGREYFTYEMMLGMCPICTGFWITLCILLSVNFFYYPVNVFFFSFSSHLNLVGVNIYYCVLK